MITQRAFTCTVVLIHLLRPWNGSTRSDLVLPHDPKKYPHLDPNLILTFICLVVSSQDLGRVTSHAMVDGLHDVLVVWGGIDELWSPGV